MYMSLSSLLVVGFGIINLIVFREVKKAEEEQLYELARQHFKHYLCNPKYRGEGYAVVNPNPDQGYRVFLFEDPSNPLRTVKVGIKKESTRKRAEALVKRLMLIEFVFVFTLVLLFQTLVESYIGKLKDKEEWVRGLMLSLMHRLGNFMATQRVLLAMLKKNSAKDANLQRMERSLQRAQREFSIFMNLAKENPPLEVSPQNLEELIKESLKYFEEELGKKRLVLSLREMHVRINRTDLEDVLYNLIGNAVKHSKSLLHLKVCPKLGILVIRNDVGEGVSFGMGIGVELTRRVLKRYGFELRIRLKSHYTVFVHFTGRG
ncbi:MAG: hypothetical protein N3C13_03120 [Aquificaceae bacterium]|nr:hypothetical protein [Aquificaceae bacterium]